MPADSLSGQVEARFLTGLRRSARPVRGIGVLLVSVFGVLTVPDEFLPLGLALLGFIAVGAVVDCWVGSGRAAPLTLGLAAARVVAVCATQEWTGGRPTQWALHVLTITAITLQWEWPPRLTVPVTLGLLAAHMAVVGFDAADPAVLRVLVECTLARLAFVLVRASNRRVGELGERRAALARAEALDRERHRLEREYLALLHDTASSTFLLVAAHGEDTEPRQVADYPRRDLAVLTGAAGGATTQDSEVNLETSLGEVVARSPLTIETRWRDVPLVPASVALALVRAVREALVNVERHANVDTAVLTVHGSGRGVVVVLDDTGRGFDPGEVPSPRRGIRGSIVERMAAAGGRAEVTSSPATGTSVRLAWPDD